MKLPYVIAILCAALVANTSPVPEPEANVLGRRDDGVECGPGKGVWVPGLMFLDMAASFCTAAEGSDISDGYMYSDTFLVELNTQGSEEKGPAGKIIFAIRNDGERPAYHVTDWSTKCYDYLKVFMDNECKGTRGDTKGGINTIGNIKYEATIKEGDVWT
ncbi:hypothetical protein BU16DRAFT_567165 [Lophium mytilinum]|uniref:Uncharacterized protein n=1 Tax=Lophium mytilinum TaxID=390894 RepID=A0A6A6QF09_9PEZI|nr:hypothetical protein BU16DRAFT_567165 [Lophium mytilinum]